MSEPDTKTPSPEIAENNQPVDPLFGKGKNVLLIEDDPSSAELIRKLLTNHGFDILHAKNGKEAWDKIRPETKPNLIISDFLMPEMDGFQFLKGLKKEPLTQNIPIIFLSARKNIEDSLLVSGADAFFPKPLDTVEFMKKIEKLSQLQISTSLPEKTEGKESAS